MLVNPPAAMRHYARLHCVKMTATFATTAGSPSAPVANDSGAGGGGGGSREEDEEGEREMRARAE